MFDFSEIEQNILSIPEKTVKAVEKYGETVGTQMERYAKQNRPWTDRTGQARQRLHSYVERPEKYVVNIYLSHGVDYGESLEYGHEKRYAIVYPTLRRYAKKVMHGLKEIL